MKTILFSEDTEKSVILDCLEAECIGKEPYTFVRSFTAEEIETKERDYVDLCKKLSSLNDKLKEVSEPVKSEIKPIAKEIEEIIQELKRGGVSVTETVYIFPDYENRQVGFYDAYGRLVGSRGMTHSERQLHINSFNQRAI